MAAIQKTQSSVLTYLHLSAHFSSDWMELQNAVKRYCWQQFSGRIVKPLSRNWRLFWPHCLVLSIWVGDLSICFAGFFLYRYDFLCIQCDVNGFHTYDDALFLAAAEKEIRVKSSFLLLLSLLLMSVLIMFFLLFSWIFSSICGTRHFGLIKEK